jgi:LPXTG-motif cell wall-anchored protein
MKKILLVTILLLTLTGCAYFSERAAAMQQCGGDQACIQAVLNNGKAAKAVGDSTGIPWAGAAAGGLVALITLFFAKKKKENP